MVKHKVDAVYVLVALIILNAPASPVRVRAPIVIRFNFRVFYMVLAYSHLVDNVRVLGSVMVHQI